MDWIYRSPASQVDREQYLLGKKIDRQVDPLLASEDRERQVRGSSVRCLLALSLSLSLCMTGPGQRAWGPVLWCRHGRLHCRHRSEGQGRSPLPYQEEGERGSQTAGLKSSEDETAARCRQ